TTSARCRGVCICVNLFLFSRSLARGTRAHPRRCLRRRSGRLRGPVCRCQRRYRRRRSSMTPLETLWLCSACSVVLLGSPACW
uniref:Uncharacterized protein n=1 Tax=Anopheles atroparvus TaxID=41427 RepID=A0AAG5DR06_ANOAO